MGSLVPGSVTTCCQKDACMGRWKTTQKHRHWQVGRPSYCGGASELHCCGCHTYKFLFLPTLRKVPTLKVASDDVYCLVSIGGTYQVSELIAYVVERCIHKQQCFCAVVSQGTRHSEDTDPYVLLNGAPPVPPNTPAAAPPTTPRPHPPQDYGFDGLWPRRPGHARLRHGGHFPEVPFARDEALALIRGGATPRDAVSQCAAEHHVDAISLALAVGGAPLKKEHTK